MADKHAQMDKINEVLTITVGALAQLDVKGQLGLQVTQNGFCTTTTILAQVEGMTSGEGTGLMLGVANGDLNDGEIEEAIEAQGPFFKDQTPQHNRAARMVRFVGPIGPQAHETPSTLLTHFEFFSKFETRIAFSEDKAGMLNWFVYNAGPAALTTGITVRLVLLHNVRWSK